MSEEKVVSIIVAALSAKGGIILAALSLPLAIGKVAPNKWYGFRTKRTLSDQAIWYAANRAAGRAGIIAGCIMFVSALAIGLAGYGEPWALYAQVGVDLGTVLGMLVYCLWALRRL